MRPRSKISSFTLVELLIVIAILAVLAAAVVIVLNPAELLAQARDSQRLSDISTLKNAVDLMIVDDPSVSLGTPQKVYISIPDTSATCANITGLPVLPAGWTYNCVTSENLRKTDSTGWVPLNFSAIIGGSPIPFLPIDPVNDALTGRYYTYTMRGSYELTALMEAQKSFANIRDGGSFVEIYEVGTDLSLLPVSRDPSLVGYWTFDGTGTISNGQTAGLIDRSGRDNNGTASNVNGSGMSFVTGKVGNAVDLDGIDDYVAAGSPTLLRITDSFTISAWVKPAIIGSWLGFTELYSGSSIVRSLYYCHGSSPMYYTTFSDNSYSTFYGSSSGMVAGQWVHLVFNYDQPTKTYKFYQNGNLTNMVTRALYEKYDSNTMKVGRVENHYSQASVDDLRIYNRALSSTEIKSMYDATK